jgi:hypothetical protein
MPNFRIITLVSCFFSTQLAAFNKPSNMNSLTPSSHRISLQKAKEMTTRFRGNQHKVLKSEFANKNIIPHSETFNREAFERLLAQPGCVGIRIYSAMTEEMELRFIAVGVNQNNGDILPAIDVQTTADTSEEDGSVIVEDGTTCPPTCPPPSPLNT